MATTAAASRQAQTPQHEDRMLNVLAWIELHRTQLAVGLLALVLAIAGAYVWRHIVRERELAANRALFELRQRIGRTESPPAATDYFKVAERYPSTGVASRARLLGAAALFGEGRYAEAQGEFEKLLGTGTSGVLAAAAAFGVAACLDAQEKVDQAITQYQAVITRFPEEAVAGQAQLALGQIYEGRKQPEMALRFYDELLRDRNRSAWADEAAGRKETVLRHHPELAGTNAPAPQPATPGY